MKQDKRIMVVGRAATALYLILKVLDKPGRKVLVPGNICYAAVYPILYTGMEPLFCDVDKYSGNVSLGHVEQVLSKDVVAIIIPHMYGNIVEDMKKIYELCNRKGIIVIQDNASAMGIEPSYALDSVSDYIIYSTGYAKTIDLGGGGIICSVKELNNEFFSIECKLDPLPDDAGEAMALFSSIYRIMRNTGEKMDVISHIYEILPDLYRKYFVYCIDKAERDRILHGVDILPEIIKRRREAKEFYDSRLKEYLPSIGYHFNIGSVPWRYNILVEPSLRKEIVKKCLNKKISVSDWYPSVLPMFQVRKELKGVMWHGQHILNFPLLIPSREIEKICRIIIETISER